MVCRPHPSSDRSRFVGFPILSDSRNGKLACGSWSRRACCTRLVFALRSPRFSPDPHCARLGVGAVVKRVRELRVGHLQAQAPPPALVKILPNNNNYFTNNPRGVLWGVTLMIWTNVRPYIIGNKTQIPYTAYILRPT
eukprot:2885335-Pyramimonas_sp.AAC.2